MWLMMTLGLAVLVPGLAGAQETVTVPNVVGQTLEAAQEALSVYNFTVNVTEACSDTVPADSVISQDPAGGTEVTSGPTTTVSLVVSSGPCPVTVPNVVFLEQAVAEANITAAGLTVGTVTNQCDNVVPAGRVISQTPVSGTSVQPGSTVDLVVASGPCPVTVPDVTGLNQVAAQSALTGAGLQVGTVLTQCSDTVSAGDVISQDPAGGTTVLYGDLVSLVISSGPCPAAVTVPNVSDLSQDAASLAITAAGLVVGQVTEQCSDTVPEGSVISQNPVSGVQAAPGSAVNLVISSGVCEQPIPVPDVTGLAQAAAQAAVTAAGLTVVTPGLSICSDTVPAGQVITQFPAAGTQVTPGSQVLLVVSSGPCDTGGEVQNVTVPNVVGQTQSAAESALTLANLNLGVVANSCSDAVPAGQSVARGSAVDLVVSRGLNLDPPSNRDIMKQLYDRLSELDGNGDGLSLEEAVAQEGLPGLAIEVFELVDKDGDGFITEEEFVEYLGIGGCFGCVKRLFVKDMLVSAGGDLLLAGLGLAMLSAVALRRKH